MNNEILRTFLILLVCALGAPKLDAAQPLTKVIMTTGSFSEREAAMYVAQDHGFFRRYGLDLSFVHVRSGPVGMAALASGETQLHEGSVTGAVLGSAAEGTDLVFVAGLINKLIGNIMASPNIKTPSDLKGKHIGVTSASGGSWMFTTLALEYWGLDAKRDGITAQLPIPFQSTGIMTTRRFINSSPEVIDAVVRGVVDSLAFIAQPENKPAVLKSLMKGLRLQKVEQAVEGYESLPRLYERRIYPRADGVRNVIRLLGQTNEKIRKLKAEDLVDDRFVRKLEKEGRF
ncbi:MAG TPA: ABC transporter substrate-binding protein [Candidatus Binatia bacterium]|nr:ABC transporter substrate-binding protein [Candidatus Binatia bacterium]